MPYLNALLILLLSLPLGMGVGSGGLFLVYLTDVLNITREGAVYLNLVFFVSALLSSAALHLRAGRLSLSVLLYTLLFGIPGSIFGHFLSKHLPPLLLRLLLAALLIFSGISALTALKRTEKEKEGADALDK